MKDKYWFKGNLHTHTTNSDGDADPEVVVEWYMRHGYDFLVLSDHNHRTILDYGGIDGSPLMIPGEEVSACILGREIPIHLNGIGISHVIEPVDAESAVETIQANVDRIISADGIAQLNHPNASWAFGASEIKKVQGATLLEIYNGWPGSNNEGGIDRDSTEEIWDAVLSSGQTIYGVATDDAHNYMDFDHTLANPGRGWVVVRADELSVDSIKTSLASGEFYFSTGVEFVGITNQDEGLMFEIVQERDYVYQTMFIGENGVVLDETSGLNPTYKFQGSESYVRTVVKSSYGTRAWTQPVFLK